MILSFDIGLKNLSYCLIKEDHTIVEWDNVNIHSTAVLKRIDNVIALLDKIHEKYKEEQYHVVVEIQMKAVMKQIETVIITYFRIKKQSLTDNSVLNVDRQHAKHKLKYYEKEEEDIPIKYKKFSTNYALNKYLGKAQCNAIIHRSEPLQEDKFLQLYKKSKKKDDLADSFLQARAYGFIKKINS